MGLKTDYKNDLSLLPLSNWLDKPISEVNEKALQSLLAMARAEFEEWKTFAKDIEKELKRRNSVSKVKWTSKKKRVK